AAGLQLLCAAVPEQSVCGVCRLQAEPGVLPGVGSVARYAEGGLWREAGGSGSSAGALSGCAVIGRQSLVARGSTRAAGQRKSPGGKAFAGQRPTTGDQRPTPFKTEHIPSTCVTRGVRCTVIYR